MTEIAKKSFKCVIYIISDQERNKTSNLNLMISPNFRAAVI